MQIVCVFLVQPQVLCEKCFSFLSKCEKVNHAVIFFFAFIWKVFQFSLQTQYESKCEKVYHVFTIFFHYMP